MTRRALAFLIFGLATSTLTPQRAIGAAKFVANSGLWRVYIPAQLASKGRPLVFQAPLHMKTAVVTSLSIEKSGLDIHGNCAWVYHPPQDSNGVFERLKFKPVKTGSIIPTWMHRDTIMDSAGIHARSTTGMTLKQIFPRQLILGTSPESLPSITDQEQMMSAFAASRYVIVQEEHEKEKLGLIEFLSRLWPNGLLSSYRHIPIRFVPPNNQTDPS